MTREALLIEYYYNKVALMEIFFFVILSELLVIVSGALRVLAYSSYPSSTSFITHFAKKYEESIQYNRIQQTLLKYLGADFRVL